MKRPSQAKQIALSAISCAFATAALTLGNYVDVLFGAAYVLAVLSLMLPLAADSVWGDALCFAATLLLSFFTCSFFFPRLVPFAVFFGLHPLANYLQKKYVKRKPLLLLCELCKAVWFDLAMWLSFSLLAGILGLESAFWYDTVMKYFYLILFLGGTLFFAIYDVLIFYCQKSVNAVLARLRK